MFNISEINMIKLSVENELEFSKSLDMDKCVIDELNTILDRCNKTLKENHNQFLAFQELKKQ